MTETKVTKYFLELFIGAMALIPESFHSETRVYVKATAGMRLTSVENQERTYDQIYEGLHSHPDFAFKLDRADIGTISGESEGLYAGISVNYLAKRVAGDLMDTGFRIKGTLGALDMGGGSSQIVFQPRNVSVTSDRLSMENFWSHSYLGFGVDQIRLMVWTFLATEYKADKTQRRAETEGAPSEIPLPVVYNPCGFRGHVQHWEAVALHGTGDSDACSELLRKLVFGPECKPVKRLVNLGAPDHALPQSAEPVEVPKKAVSGHHPPCEMGGIVVPSTRGMEFYAMSVYFFALHAAITLVPEKLQSEGKHDALVDAVVENWPTPSVGELRSLVDEFCSTSWSTLKELPKHEFTSPDQLSHRCVEVNWILEMLSSGYAIPDDARSITYAFSVSGMEVEWTLGFVLSLVSKTDKVHTCRMPTVNATQADLEKYTSIGSAALAAESTA